MSTDSSTRKISFKDRASICRPYRLRPALKSAIWGGSRLAEAFGKSKDFQKLAETWECSVHPSGESLIETCGYVPVDCGRLAGNGWEALNKDVDTGGKTELTLKDFIDTNPAVMGESFIAEDSHSCLPEDEKSKEGENKKFAHDNFPVLIKLIDAADNLSVQVHPDDEFAQRYENGQSGKTEAWYILEASEDSELVFGLKSGVTEEILRDAAADGNILKCVSTVHPRKGELYYIEAGTIHSIGRGIVVLEVQQSSDVTYRLYDYGRKDSEGKTRELHLAKGLKAIRYGFTGQVIPADTNLTAPGRSQERELLNCKYFRIRCLRIGEGGSHEVEIDGRSFVTAVCTETGATGMTLISGELCMKVIKGQSIFLPAWTGTVSFCGEGEILLVDGGSQ